MTFLTVRAGVLITLRVTVLYAAGVVIKQCVGKTVSSAIGNHAEFQRCVASLTLISMVSVTY